MSDPVSDPAPAYARALLGRCRAQAPLPASTPEAAAARWARSGAMALTGETDGPPRLAPGPLAACAHGAGLALQALAGSGWREGPLDGAGLLGERAARLGLVRRGRTTPGNTTRLLRARDGWLALCLARDEDLAALPAWLEAGPVSGDPWCWVSQRIRTAPLAALVERARLLGLAAAASGPAPVPTPPWLRVAAEGPPAASRAQPPLVVDLSSLWAGPLCGGLLARAGARVIKVEALERPDGARRGEEGFFALLNADKESVALPFASERGRARLAALIARADVVIEASRPRALRQLGIDAEAHVRSAPGRVWVSVSGYGRRPPAGEWIAFGDDAAVAAGLAQATGDEDAPLFCGDAIADPLAGLHAAVAALAAWRTGRGALLELALCDVTAHAAASAPSGDAEVCRNGEGWEIRGEFGRAPVAEPRAREARAHAPALGADTDRILRELGAC